MESSRDHEVQDHPNVVRKADGDTFAQSAKHPHLLACARADGRLDRSQQERILEYDVLETPTDDPTLQRFDVNDDVGKLRHDPAGYGLRATGYGLRATGYRGRARMPKKMRAAALEGLAAAPGLEPDRVTALEALS
jgi:hypothetical protein